MEGGGAAFVLRVNNRLAKGLFLLHVHRASRKGSLLTSLTFLLLHKNVSPG